MQKAAARQRRSYTAARPFEDTRSNLMFKLTNTAAQGRLPNKQKFRSPAKTALICGRDGVPQVRKIDNHCPALMASADQSLSVNHFSISFLWIVACGKGGGDPDRLVKRNMTFDVNVLLS